MKITVIVPIYNAMPYLDETLNSICEQHCNDCEIILVNDGSTDNSVSCCQKYVALDHRFILLSTQNQGISSARNLGITKAKYDYIWFVDADDKVADNSLNIINEFLEACDTKPDILFSNAALFDSKGPVESKKYTYDRSFLKSAHSDDVLRYLWQNLDMPFSVWRHLFRTGFVRDNSLQFLESKKEYEATDWMIKSVLCAKTFDAFEKCIYYYRIDNANSISHQKINLRILTSLCESPVRWFQYFEKEYKGESQKIMMLKMASLFQYCIRMAVHLSAQDRKAFMKIMKSDWVLSKFYSENKDALPNAQRNGRVYNEKL